MKDKIEALRRRWPWFDRAMDVQERVGEINGSFLASGVTITMFLSLFPLLLVAIAVVGFIAAGDATVAPRLIENLGLTGAAADALTSTLEHASDTRRAASVVGLLGLAWSGSGVAAALMQAVRAPWQERIEGMRDRFLGIGWLVAAAILFAVSIGLGGVLNVLPDWAPAPVATLLSIALGLAVEVTLFVWMFWGLGSRRVGVRPLLPGALVAAAGFEVLKLAGTVLVPRLVASSSALYGSLGIIFAVLAWLALFARLIVYASTLNAVRWEVAEGTLEVPIAVPKLPGRIPIAATRGGVMLDADDPEPSVPGEP
ncbi:MAG: YihY/virulence factor BrkB family protein [Acidimicrobiales bacterium]|nr:YihY/virulence factor BrkB family protein [Acidimicrobiales bacterium]HRW36791.1 YihY/virulence factor BrkB family protein [Aquihabitans sp.]